MSMEIVDYIRGKAYVSSKGTFFKVGTYATVSVLQIADDHFVAELMVFPLHQSNFSEAKSLEELKSEMLTWEVGSRLTENLEILSMKDMYEVEEGKPYSSIEDLSSDPDFDEIKEMYLKSLDSPNPDLHIDTESPVFDVLGTVTGRMHVSESNVSSNPSKLWTQPKDYAIINDSTEFEKVLSESKKAE
jgi:hypothetical protein